MFMLMAPEGFRYVSGAPKTFTRDDLDEPVTREFCENCGPISRPAGETCRS